MGTHLLQKKFLCLSFFVWKFRADTFGVAAHIVVYIKEREEIGSFDINQAVQHFI